MMISTPGFWMQAFALTLVILPLYLFVILPDRSRESRRYRDVMLLTPGQTVALTCGIIGTVVESKDSLLEVEIAPGLRVHLRQQHICAVLDPAADKPVSDAATDDQ